jgi:hypothetical protein
MWLLPLLLSLLLPLLSSPRLLPPHCFAKVATTIAAPAPSAGGFGGLMDAALGAGEATVGSINCRGELSDRALGAGNAAAGPVQCMAFGAGEATVGSINCRGELSDAALGVGNSAAGPG